MSRRYDDSGDPDLDGIRIALSYGIVHPRIPGFGWFTDEPLRISTGPGLLERFSALVKARFTARRTAKLELLEGRLAERAEIGSRRVA